MVKSIESGSLSIQPAVQVNIWAIKHVGTTWLVVGCLFCFGPKAGSEEKRVHIGDQAAVQPSFAINHKVGSSASTPKRTLAQPSSPTNQTGEFESREPALVRLATPEIRQVFIDIQTAIKQNESLPESQRLPDPYFVRAKIWAKLHNHNKALEDYLEAARIIKQNQGDLLTYAGQFVEFHEALENLSRVPQQPHPGLARQHYSAGYHAFWEQDYTSAQRHFEDAVALDQTNALYFYFLALLHRKTGDSRAAVRNARLGAYAESKMPAWQRKEIGRSLYRVQGSWRVWLEEFRRGEPHYDPNRDTLLPPELREGVGSESGGSTAVATP